MTSLNLRQTASRVLSRKTPSRRRKKVDKANVNVFIPPVSLDEKLKLKKIASSLMEPGKGILAVDEPSDELGAQLGKNGLENTPENRLGFVLAVTGDCKVMCPYVTGVILQKDVCFQRIDKDKKETIVDKLTKNGLRVGIRVDNGLVPLAGTHDEVTSSIGLDTLMSDCYHYHEMGVSFALMSCVFKISDHTPSLLGCIENANTMARFASTSQKTGLVPVLSIHVESDMSKSIGQSEVLENVEVTQDILSFVVKALADYNVYLEGVLLRLSPVASRFNISVQEIPSVAMATLLALVHRVPPAIGGVLLANVNNLKNSNLLLNEVHVAPSLKPCPITFGWRHVVHEGLMEQEWNGREKRVANIAKIITERLKTCSLASMGQLPKDQSSFIITNASET